MRRAHAFAHTRTPDKVGCRSSEQVRTRVGRGRGLLACLQVMCMSLRMSLATCFSMVWSTAFAVWFVRDRLGESALAGGTRHVFLATQEARLMLLLPAFMTLPACVQVVDALAHLRHQGQFVVSRATLGTLGYLAVALQPCALCLASGLHFEHRTEWASVLLYVVAALVLTYAMLNLLYAHHKHKWLSISVTPLRAWGLDVHAVKYKMWASDDKTDEHGSGWFLNGPMRAFFYFLPMIIGTACVAYQALIVGLREHSDCHSHPHWCAVAAWSVSMSLVCGWALLVLVVVATAIANVYQHWIPSMWCLSSVVANFVGTALLLPSQSGELFMIHALVGIGGLFAIHVLVGLLEDTDPPPVRPRVRSSEAQS